MKRPSITNVLQTLKKVSLVPLFYHKDIAVCKQLITACYTGGVRVIEFTNRGENALEVLTELLRWAANTYPDLVLGVGTIKTEAQAKLFLKAGVHFVVAPVVDLKVAEQCNEFNTPWIPGCGTLTEMHQAHLAGATIVKAFPVNVLGGTTFIKSVKAPYPELKIMPSGGIEATAEDYNKYLSAGAFCVGVGSSLFTYTSSGEFDVQAITNTCKTILKEA